MSSSDDDVGGSSDPPATKKVKTSKQEDEEARLRKKLLRKKFAAEDARRKDDKQQRKSRRDREVVLMEEEDDALPIRPPQPRSAAAAAARAAAATSTDRHRRHLHKPHRARREEKKDDKREIEKRAQEGWTRWKHSLDHPSRHSDKQQRGPERDRRGRHEEVESRRRRQDRDGSSSRSGWLAKRRGESPAEKTEKQPIGDTEEEKLTVRYRVVLEPELSPPPPLVEDKTPTQDEREDKGETTSPQEARPESVSSGSGELSSSGVGSETDEGSNVEKKEDKDAPVMKRSKFESSSEESESDVENDETEEPTAQNGSNASPEKQTEQHVTPEPQVQEAPDEGMDDVSKEEIEEEEEPVVLPIYYPGISGCRSVEEFHCLNRIEEGTYGVVYRAKEKRTDEIVALKRLKMEKEKEGFPITSLREINMLLKAGKHPNIVNVREIVVGSNMDKIYLVMDYVEHDMKSLMESMKQPFLVGEVKTLMQQLLAGVHHLHDNWILHRDLKTSNLLLSHRGILKIGDFGLAREYGSPLKPYTPIVVTLWYRAPELLLGIKEYSTAIDMWSVGCIFAEFVQLKPLFPGKGEADQINRIFKMLGTPNNDIWPGYSELPGVKKIHFATRPWNQLRKHIGANTLCGDGFLLLNRLLTYNPVKRPPASEALRDVWFKKQPLPVRPDMFPTWPAKSEQGKQPPKKAVSPKPPSGGKQFDNKTEDDEMLAALKLRPNQARPGFSLHFDAPKF